MEGRQGKKTGRVDWGNQKWHRQEQQRKCSGNAVKRWLQFLRGLNCLRGMLQGDGWLRKRIETAVPVTPVKQVGKVDRQ